MPRILCRHSLEKITTICRMFAVVTPPARLMCWRHVHYVPTCFYLIPRCRQVGSYSTFCLRIRFSSSTKFLSEVACPMSLFLFSFCWKVSMRRFLADRSLSDSSSNQGGRQRGLDALEETEAANSNDLKWIDRASETTATSGRRILCTNYVHKV